MPQFEIHYIMLCCVMLCCSVLCCCCVLCVVWLVSYCMVWYMIYDIWYMIRYTIYYILWFVWRVMKLYYIILYYIILYYIILYYISCRRYIYKYMYNDFLKREWIKNYFSLLELTYMWDLVSQIIGKFRNGHNNFHILHFWVWAA